MSTPLRSTEMLTDALRQSLRRAQDQVNSLLLGKAQEVRLAFVALLSGGHLLIEDLPGLGKTTLAHAMASSLGLGFQRVQFTSDLLPADVLGVSVYDATSRQFQFHPGPVFTNVLLADEINRAPPRTQSSLLEAMAEQQVTLDGVTHALPEPFFVIATQNPVDLSGTFPLPDSQLDRFLLRLSLGYPSADAERALLSGVDRRELIAQAAPQLSDADVVALRAVVNQIHTSDALIGYVQALLLRSRQHAGVRVGLSPRAGIALLRAAKAYALLLGREHVLPEDVQALFVAVAGHRLVPEAESSSGPALARRYCTACRWTDPHACAPARHRPPTQPAGTSAARGLADRAGSAAYLCAADPLRAVRRRVTAGDAAGRTELQQQSGAAARTAAGHGRDRQQHHGAPAVVSAAYRSGISRAGDRRRTAAHAGVVGTSRYPHTARAAPGSSGEQRFLFADRARHGRGRSTCADRAPRLAGHRAHPPVQHSALGLVRAWSWVWPETPLLAYPKPEEQGPALPDGAGSPNQTRLHAQGEELHQLRPYRAGDAPRTISWKHSARRDTLLVREYEKPLGIEVTLDWRTLNALPYERRIARLARWVNLAERDGNRYRLLLPGQPPLGPAQGPSHHHLCLRALALLPHD